MITPRIIGLTGAAGSGKNTVANRIHLYSTIPVEQRSFAAKLKLSVAALLGLSIAQIEEMKRAENYPCIHIKNTERDMGATPIVTMTMRKFLQRYGTEAHREIFGQEFWVRQTLPDGDPAYTEKLVVVTDCRFANEADRIYELGGEVWRISGPQGHTTDHASDKPLADKYVMIEIDNRKRNDNFVMLDYNIQEALCVNSLPRFSASSV